MRASETVPQSFSVLLDLADRNKEHWRKLEAVALFFVDKALKLADNLTTSGEAFYCAEKAFALLERYEKLRQSSETAASNIGIIIEFAHASEVSARHRTVA